MRKNKSFFWPQNQHSDRETPWELERELDQDQPPEESDGAIPFIHRDEPPSEPAGEHFLRTASRTLDEAEESEPEPEPLPVRDPEPPIGTLRLSDLARAMQAEQPMEAMQAAVARLAALRSRLASDGPATPQN